MIIMVKNAQALTAVVLAKTVSIASIVQKTEVNVAFVSNKLKKRL
jgi:hypothetical protein